ncbi:S1C family serine protease [Sphingorhabdus sp.]|uniref:S1C family serine protease n=1 Tax=Sphingorhabdus sp. TaxID=1902408 RepID=UPI003BAECB73|nr:trypsin-like peptidase domain-containing protein [Sphingomonadales bacterium]
MAAIRWLWLILVALAGASVARAEPSDIAAASRSVVRVAVFASEGGETPIGHGSGIVVSSNRIVTNFHVVDEEEYETPIRIVIVPSEGQKVYDAEIVDLSPGNDLALIQLMNGAKLTPGSIFSGQVGDGMDVFAIGYPGGVEVAQGLAIEDMLRPQVPVKTRGNISAGRSAKDFETLLHTAPIGSGNSGGPLVDSCGRVVGINSFGTVANGNDAEFFFAISTRELTAFLRKNGVSVRSVSGPCRSVAELNQEEAAREAAARAKIEAEQRAHDSARATTLGEARRQAEYAIIGDRENRMMLTVLLLFGALGAAGSAWQLFERDKKDVGKLAVGGAAALLLAAGMTFFTRPGFDQIDERVKETLQNDTSTIAKELVAKAGKKVCTLDPARSRVTVSDTKDVEFDWAVGGCVNGRTQYAEANGVWTRTLVPGSEAQVSVVTFEPEKSLYRVERHLLGSEAMAKAREARNRYEVKSCSGDSALLDKIGNMNRSVRELLPDQANEILVYGCK